MGYMLHHAIIVHSEIVSQVEEARLKALEIFAWVGTLSPSGVNGGRSFYIPPDGSKEGWRESRQGDRDRDQFIAWLTSQRNPDGSNSLSWVEVQFGGGASECRVTRSVDWDRFTFERKP